MSKQQRQRTNVGVLVVADMTDIIRILRIAEKAERIVGRVFVAMAILEPMNRIKAQGIREAGQDGFRDVMGKQDETIEEVNILVDGDRKIG